MAGRRAPDERWGRAARERLEVARNAAGHTQHQCAEELVQIFGAARATQASVSRWLSGQSEPECLDAVFAYCARHLPDAEQPGRDGVAVDQARSRSTRRERTGASPQDEQQPQRSPWEVAHVLRARLDVTRADLRRERQLSKRQELEIAQLHSELAQAYRDLAAAKEATDNADDTADALSGILDGMLPR